MGAFSLRIIELMERSKKDMDTIVRYAMATIDGKVDFRSPVGDAKYWTHPAPKGYAGGRFRGNWQMSIGSPASGSLDVVDPGGQATRASHVAVLAAARAGQVIYLMNNLPYAKRIEEGWSRQAPIGVVAVTVVEWNNIVDAAVNGVRAGTSAEDFEQGYKSYGI
jgi:hypothetical protein